MKSLEEFRNFCRSNLQEILADLESQRKKANVKILIAVLLAALTVLAGVYISPIAVIPMVIGLIVFIWLGPYKQYQKFHLAFKENLIRSIIRFVDEGLNYKHNYCISESAFSYSNIFNERFTSYGGDDYVSGTIGKTGIEFSELKVTRTEGSGKNRRTVTVFKGLFFIADFHKNFNGETYVLTDMAESWFGRLGSKLQSMNFSRPPLVKLEDPEFEKCFVVYSTDQVEARYILSTAFMERTLQLKKKMNCNVQMSFKDSKVFMSIPLSKNFLAPPFFGSLLNTSNIDEYFSDLKLMIEVVEDLSLNTRIWSKV